MKVLLDSWAWIELFRGTSAGTRVLKEVKKARLVLTTSVNLYEVCCRIKQDEGTHKMKQAQSFIENRSSVLPIDKNTALAAIDVRLEEGLRAVDAFTLAVARLSDARVLSGDKHFKHIKDVIYCGD